jgi:hypothetical protein
MRTSARPLFLAISLAGLAALLPALGASAVSVAFQVTGVITGRTDPGNLFPGLFTIGTPYTAVVSYDSALAAPDSHPSSEQGNYAFPSGGLDMSFTASGHTFAAHTPPGNIEVFNGSGGDTLRYFTDGAPTYDGGAPPGGPGRLNLNLFFAIFGSSPSAILSEALPLAAPDHTAFTLRGFEVTKLDSAFPENTVYQFLASVTSVTPIPEPSAGALTALGVLSLAWLRKPTGRSCCKPKSLRRGPSR